MCSGREPRPVIALSTGVGKRGARLRYATNPIYAKTQILRYTFAFPSYVTPLGHNREDTHGNCSPQVEGRATTDQYSF